MSVNRTVLVCLALASLLLVAAAFALTVGRFTLPVSSVLQAIAGEGNPMAQQIVRAIRLPRVLTAVLVGCALGISGAIFQSVSRNALGSPDVIGFTTGAATGAIVQIVLFNGNTAQNIALTTTFHGVELTGTPKEVVTEADSTPGVAAELRIAAAKPSATQRGAYTSAVALVFDAVLPTPAP